MTAVLFGFDYVGVQSLKITKGTINPVTEPDSNVGSFLFNSKWAADYKLTGIDMMGSVGADTFWPAGSGLVNYTKYSELTYPAGQTSYFRKAHFPTLPFEYDLPLCEVKSRRISNGRFIGSLVSEVLSGYENRGGNWRTAGREWAGWGKGMTVAYNSTTGSISSGSVVTNYFSQPAGVTNEVFYNNLVVWRLPGDETAVLDGAPVAPVSGQHAIEIDSAGVRIAKPGFDARTATPTQMALDTARHPTKVIGAADVACPAGVSYYDIGVTIPAGAVADVHFYQGSIILYPANPVATPYGAEYWFDGSRIYFNNAFAACRARFIVYAIGTDAPTSGANDVLRQFNDGSQEVFQILRPGAAANPSWADIVIDSRWPCIQILAQGFISVGAGDLTHVVDFNGTGCFPVVKYMTVHGASGATTPSPYVLSYSKLVRQPFTNVIGSYKVGWTYQQGGDSTYCELSASQARFRTFVGNPIRRYYRNFADFQGDVITYQYDPSPLYGIRYFILGIPA
ncbi:UNVERIFIED_ORG: hypothetical protein LHK14_18065 [Roseateles sp. XES5]|nr:hypothetical protein [Roseateles sp. XES5]